jgi:thiamine-phosphate diphosphorylase
MDDLRFRLPSRLYTIADSLGQREESFYSDIVGDFLAGGAKIVQFRAKELTSRKLLEVTRVLRQMTAGVGAIIIVNDRVDVALSVGADGVHLGQGDLPVESARKILGARTIIGISTHNEEQALAAEKRGADYIGFGPIFPTSTKQSLYSARGLEGIRRVRAAVRLPIVAIGGITEETFLDVLAAGADAAAFISDLVLSKERKAKVRRLLRLSCEIS